MTSPPDVQNVPNDWRRELREAQAIMRKRQSETAKLIIDAIKQRMKEQKL